MTDFRYDTLDNSRSFHEERIAFIIIGDDVEFIKNSKMSHFEYAKEKNISKEEFNSLIRGYYLNGNLVFYKDNFIYDEKLINDSVNYIDIIFEECKIEKANIYFGVKVGNPGEIWPLDHFYGEVIKSNKGVIK